MYEKYEVLGKTVIKLNIKNLTPELKNMIDEQIINICEGSGSFRHNQIDLQNNIRKVKKELYNRIINKTEDTKIGMIAEFFIHLVLSQEDIKQECLFFNMTERSIKKGFDGLYSKNEELWIMESKGGKHSTQNITHHGKIQEAFRDLEKKLRGELLNDPWREAYNNVKQEDVQTTREMKQLVQEALIRYEDKNYLSINECNIIPSGTIFSDCNSYQNFAGNTLTESNGIFTNNYKDIIVFYSTNNIFQEFIDYLNQDN